MSTRWGLEGWYGQTYIPSAEKARQNYEIMRQTLKWSPPSPTIFCARKGRLVTESRCEEIVLRTVDGKRLKVCRECSHGKTLISTVPMMMP